MLQSEIAIVDILKEEGYASCYVGEWELCRSFEEGNMHPMVVASTVSSALLAVMTLLYARGEAYLRQHHFLFTI
ncbi:MAG: hypothetical protein CL877_00275 [Dehalococcoidales bacterium]|nr:hypothetical protein [Dehalococcoidales bacterium]